MDYMGIALGEIRIHDLLIFSYQRDITGSTLIFSVRFLEGCFGGGLDARWLPRGDRQKRSYN